MPPEDQQSIQPQMVSAICLYLHRAYRDLRLYPSGHPMARQAVDGLKDRLIKHLDTHGSLVLDVQENGLLYDGQAVYVYDASRDNLAFLMFRDGIRTLSFRSGLEPIELEGFVSRLAHADDLENADYDLVTALWEDDFAHIDYTLVDLFMEGEVLTEGAIEDLRDMVITRLEEVGAEPNEETAPDAPTIEGGVEVVDLMSTDLSSLTLTEDEVARGDMAAALPMTTVEEFAVVLFEILGHYPWRIEEGDGLYRALVTVVASYVRTGDLEQIDFLIERLKEFEAQGRCSPGFVGAVLSNSVTSQDLDHLLQKAGQASAMEMAQIQDFLSLVCQWVMPALLELLADTPDRGIRRGLLALLSAGEGVPAPLLAPLMSDRRWYVVRNAVQLAAVSREESLLGDLQRLTRHPEVRVRREVMRTLSAIGGPKAARLLANSLSDEDPSVRILAAGGVTRHGGPEHEVMVLAQINSKDFDTRSPDETDALLHAYAVIGRERAVPLLDRLWRSKLFDSRTPAVRSSAVKALGLIPGPAAQAALREAMKSGRGQVGRDAERALQESLARQQGRT
jgi:HEAT repeat protein